MSIITKQRFDLTDLIMGKNVKETPQGFLEIEAFTARTGIQRYFVDGAILDEFRPEDEVFSDTSINSLKTAPLTDGHPKEFVNPDNVKELMVGFPNGQVDRREDGGESFLVTKVIVTHRKGIDAIKKGKVQLSNGYNVDLDFTAGEHKGKKFDAVQRNIVNNHIALVFRGRAGAKASLRLDEGQGILLQKDENKPNIGEMMKLTIDGKEFEVSDEAGNAIKAKMSKSELEAEDLKKKNKELKAKGEKADDLETENEILKASKSKLIAKADSLQSDLDKKSVPKMDEEKLDVAVKERIAVLETGKSMLSKDEVEKIDSMKNEEIKIAVVKIDSPKVDEEKLKDSNYVNARFDHIVENMDNSKTAKADLGKKVVENRKENKDDEGYKTPEEIRQARMDEDLSGKKED